MVARHIHDVFFNGKSLADFGVHVNGTDVFNSPEEDVENVEVPGRNGDLHIFNNRFKNVELKYHSFVAWNSFGQVSRFRQKAQVSDIPLSILSARETRNSESTEEAEFRANIRSLRNWLLANRGYQRLEDTYHPDEYRLARFSGKIETTAEQLKVGEFDMTFDCKPQRFLKSGDFAITYTKSGSIFNPTFFTSQPKLRVYGKGTLEIGDTIITILSTYPYSYIDIDCEIQDAFYENGTTTVNCNPYISLVDGDFFKIDPDVQTITLGSGITKVEIIPRWWIV